MGRTMATVLKAFITSAMLAATAFVNTMACAAGSVTVGSVAMDIPVEMIKRFDALTEYLSKTTGIQVTFRPSPNLGSAVDDLGQNRTQISYLTPVAYLDARDKYQVKPLVAPTVNGKPSFSLVIGVRENGPIKSVNDLKGKRFAFGDEKALLQKAAVVSMGLKLEDFSNTAYLKHYDNIAKAVLAGDFDGGILKDSVASDFKPMGIKVIGTTPPLPSYVFAVNKDTPKPLVDVLRQAFIGMKKGSDGEAALSAFDHAYDGFTEVTDQDYDSIRALISPFKAK